MPVTITQNQNPTMLLPTTKTLEIIQLDDIVYVHAYESYSKVFLKSGRFLICTLHFGEITSKLLELGFYQTHKSYVLNLKHIVRYYKTGDVELYGNTRVPLARRRKEEFLLQVSEYVNGGDGVRY